MNKKMNGLPTFYTHTTPIHHNEVEFFGGFFLGDYPQVEDHGNIGGAFFGSQSVLMLCIKESIAPFLVIGLSPLL